MKKLGLIMLLGLSFLQAGCGGGGSGGSGSGPSEILYAVSANGSGTLSGGVGSCTSGDGCITEYAFDPSTGSLYGGNASISTAGVNPFQVIFDPNGSYAYVLNNGNSSTSGANCGSIASFSLGSQGLSTSPIITPVSTGAQSYTMDVDSKGQYLVVANHGGGSGGCSTGGGVQIFSLSSGNPTLQNSSIPCSNPDKVLFEPSSDGTTGEYVYITCTDLVPPASASASIYQCTVSQLIAGSGCTQVITSLSSTILYNLVVDPSGQYAFVPAYQGGTGGIGGFLMMFTISASHQIVYQNDKLLSSSPTSFYPSGEIGIMEDGTTQVVFVGSYPCPSSSCTSGAPTDLIEGCSFGGTGLTACSSNTTSLNYPLYMAVNSLNLYVAFPNTYLGTTQNGTGGIGEYTASTTGTLTALSGSPISSANDIEPTQIVLDTTNGFAAVPYQGAEIVNFFQIQSNGELSVLSSLPVNGNPSLAYIH